MLLENNNAVIYGGGGAFVAPDKARTMTAATANISCGALID